MSIGEVNDDCVGWVIGTEPGGCVLGGGDAGSIQIRRLLRAVVTPTTLVEPSRKPKHRSAGH